MPKDLLIFPAGGNAREAATAIAAINSESVQWNICGFVDDDPSLKGKNLDGIPVLGGKEIIRDFSDAYVLAVVGNPDNFRKREYIIESLDVSAERYATIIHPQASIASDAKIGTNVLVMSQVVISCGVSIGNHCIILPNTTIEHDAVIDDYTCIGANVVVSGSVIVGRNCYIGSGSSILNGVCIGSGSLIGLGSNVIRDVGAEEIVAGNPAKPLPKKEM